MWEILTVIIYFIFEHSKFIINFWMIRSIFNINRKRKRSRKIFLNSCQKNCFFFTHLLPLKKLKNIKSAMYFKNVYLKYQLKSNMRWSKFFRGDFKNLRNCWSFDTFFCHDERKNANSCPKKIFLHETKNSMKFIL